MTVATLWIRSSTQNPELMYLARTDATLMPHPQALHSGLKTEEQSRQGRAVRVLYRIHTFLLYSTLFAGHSKSIEKRLFLLERHGITTFQTPIFNTPHKGPLCTKKIRKAVWDKSANLKIERGKTRLTLREKRVENP
jgi:hypothetical protein